MVPYVKHYSSISSEHKTVKLITILQINQHNCTKNNLLVNMSTYPISLNTGTMAKMNHSRPWYVFLLLIVFFLIIPIIILIFIIPLFIIFIICTPLILLISVFILPSDGLVCFCGLFREVGETCL